MSSERFRRCSSCGKDIGFGATYWLCSVSTCNRARLGLFFCSPSCWDAHLPEARHREAWAEEKKAPTHAEWLASGESAEDASPAPRRVVVTPSGPGSSTSAHPAGHSSSPSAGRTSAPTATTGSGSSSAEIPSDVLVVVSKLKAYIRARFGMNTSDGVTDVISDELRRICDLAARHAAGDGRKTVLDRDFKAILLD